MGFADASSSSHNFMLDVMFAAFGTLICYSSLLAWQRWKEQYFVNVGADCGLTIAGFYYVCFSCSDGSINGFYYDPNSSPFQKLELKSTNEGRSGFSFLSYELV
ncbi:Glucose-induced degradation protein 4-like protein [Drosera capensis]